MATKKTGLNQASLMAIVEAAIKHVNAGPQMVQDAALKAIAFAAQHGQVGPIERLCKGIVLIGKDGKPKPHPYTVGLSKMLRAFTPIIMSPSQPWTLRKKDAEGYKPFDLKGVEANPFWSFQPEVDPRVFGESEVTHIIEGAFKQIAKVINGETENRVWGGGEAKAAKVRLATKAAKEAWDKIMAQGDTAAATIAAHKPGKPATQRRPRQQEQVAA